MVERVGGRKIGRGEVKIAAAHEHLEIRILTHRLAERLGDVDVLAFEGFVAPAFEEAREDFVGQIAPKAKLAPHVIIEGRGVWALNGGIRGIVLEHLASGVAVNPLKTAVQTPDGAPFISQQLLDKAEDADAQVALFDIGLAQSGVACERSRRRECGFLRGGSSLS